MRCTACAQLPGLPPPPPLLATLLLLMLLLPIASATVWVECASSMCVECHDASVPAPLNLYRWFSTGWFDCQTGSALSYTDFCRQQPLPFNQTPPFSSIFSSEKEMAFGNDGGDPDHPFLVKIPFKPTSPMATASINASSSLSAVTLQYTAPTRVHDIIPMKFTLPMCVQPLPSASSVSSGRIGLLAPAGDNGLWLYIVDKRGLTFAGAVANASAPRRSPLSQMGVLSAANAFTASSGCKYVYALLYVAHPSSPADVVVSLDWLPQASMNYGGVLSFNYLSAEKFEFDPARVEGKYNSLQPVCDPQLCDGRDALFDVVIDGLGGATLSLVMAPVGDVSSPNGIRMMPVAGDGYRLGNVLEFPTSQFGGGTSNLMVTITGIEPVRRPLPLRLLSNFGAILVSGVQTTDIWAEFALNSINNSNSMDARTITVTTPPEQVFSVSPRVTASVCPTYLSPVTLTNLANIPVGPALSLSTFSNCRRVCGVADAVTGLASVVSSGGDRCGAPVFIPGDTATVVCTPGYWLSGGTEQRICNSDYSFSGNASVCSPFQCPALAAPLNGALLPTPYWKGMFSCNTHWKIVGSAVLTCLSSGQWNSPAPTCLRAVCNPTTPPEHGHILVQPTFNYSVGNATEYTTAHPHVTQAIGSGSLLVLSCELGFHLAGDRVAVCEPSEKYNASLGTCVPVPCRSFSTLNLPPRAVAVPASIRYLDVAIVTCESGYRFENGSAEISASCDVYGNVSLEAQVPLCLRIPNFCEKTPWACGVIVSWPFALAAVAALWFYVLQSVLVVIVLPSTGDQIMLRCTRMKSLNMLSGLVRKKWALHSDEFLLRIVHCSASDDVVSVCRQLSKDATELSAPLMLKRLYELKLPQLSRFWDHQPRLVLCICHRDDSLRVFVKRNSSSASNNADDQVQVVENAHHYSIKGAQRWRHIHSNSLVSIAPSSAQSLPPARAAKVFSWMHSSKAAWEMPGESAVAWQATLRRDAALWGQNDAENQADEAAGMADSNRWVSKGFAQMDSTILPVMYEISVVTGNEFGAGTDSRVYCTLYNEDGVNSKELALETSLQNSDAFETGSTDTFRHVLKPMGRVTSVRIRYDATGFGADWLLERVRVKDVSTGEVTEFEHGGWLSENTTSVFLQARHCRPAFPYEIGVITGTASGAGTDSKVYCTLFGNVCVGNSGELALVTSLNHADPFETGATDTFLSVLPRSLGRISAIRIRHDASGLGSDWLLDRVVVKDVTSGETTQFEHGSWLTKENCSVVLQAHGLPIQSASSFLYEISIDTGVDAGSGTDSNVYCMLYGEDGDNSGELVLAKSLQHTDAFETGHTDTFQIMLPRSVGRVVYVRIRHDATGVGSDWKMERVRVKDISTGVTIEFDHGDWLTNRKTEVLLQSCQGMPSFLYEIAVVTGKEMGAGTDSKVFCTLHGESWASCGELALTTSLDNSDAFETGHTDTFRKVLPRSLGRVASIRIRYDATGFGSDWLLDRVMVKNVTSGEVTEFEHSSWLTRECREVVIEAPPILSLPGSTDSNEATAASQLRQVPQEEPTEAGALPRVESPEVVDAPSSHRDERFERERLERERLERERLERVQKLLLRIGFTAKR